MARILLIGEDEFLLKTRAAILKQLKATTVWCDSRSAITVQREQRCDIVVLCHSLRAKLSGRLAQAIRAEWPATRILQINVLDVSRSAKAEAMVDGVCLPDPEQLLARIQEMLESAGDQAPPLAGTPAEL